LNRRTISATGNPTITGADWPGDIVGRAELGHPNREWHDHKIHEQENHLTIKAARNNGMLRHEGIQRLAV